MITPVRLKNKWHKAICSDGLKVSADAASEARRAVMVVPMLEPRISGNILANGTIPMVASGVIAAVNTELLCTRTVPTNPINISK